MRCDYCGWDVMCTCDCNSAVLDSKDPVSGIRTSALTDLRARLSAAEKRAEAVREPVRWFAERMEDALRDNDDKGGWDGCEYSYLLERLYDEAQELDSAIDDRDGSFISTFDDIIQEAADVANFAMMLADKARAALANQQEDAE